MRGLLDDPREIARIDTGGMFDAIFHLADPFLNPPTFRNAGLISSRVVNGVVFVGMGGSASAGDVLIDWLRNEMGVYSMVSREANIPSFVDKRTLVVCLSYSGDTWETLRAFKQAWTRGCGLAAVGSGGMLSETCRVRQVPFFRVIPGQFPRAALGQMIVAGSEALQRMGMVSGIRRRLVEAGRELASIRAKLQPSVPLPNNNAKKLALLLENRYPSIYGFQRMASVARRFKNQLAENSKMVARYELLPEAGHNEVESWKNTAKSFIPLIIRDSIESPEENGIAKAFKLTIARAGRNHPVDLQMRARSGLGRLLAPILFLDYVSAYLALLGKEDPSSTPAIRTYRRNMLNVARIRS